MEDGTVWRVQGLVPFGLDSPDEFVFFAWVDRPIKIANGLEGGASKEYVAGTQILFPYLAYFSMPGRVAT
jgi:hypothetical protein